MNLSLSPRCSTTKLLLPSPLQNRMAMISLRPAADGQVEQLKSDNVQEEQLKSEHEEHIDPVSEEMRKDQNKFNAFRPWVSGEEKDQPEDSRNTDDEYGEVWREPFLFKWLPCPNIVGLTFCNVPLLGDFTCETTTNSAYCYAAAIKIMFHFQAVLLAKHQLIVLTVTLLLSKSKYIQ